MRVVFQAPQNICSSGYNLRGSLGHRLFLFIIPAQAIEATLELPDRGTNGFGQLDANTLEILQ